MERLEQFFSANFLMPHGACFLWLPEILWLHVVADIITALAYFSIPVALWHFARRRPDMPFRPLFLLFAAFISLCGLTHIFGIIVLWYPIYGIEGLVMLATGMVSIITAVVIWRILPTALTLPSPATFQKMNEELKTSYHLIEEKVEQRTLELQQANEQLEIEKKKLTKANQAKKDFVANISHELKTPLNVLVVLAEKLQRGDIPEAKKAEVKKSLADSANTLSELISDILDFSKIESNALELVIRPFSLQEVLDEVNTIASVQADEKNIAFKLEGDAESLPELVGDPLRLKQILLNLTSNAVKFTDTGHVLLQTDTTIQDATAEITFFVHDTGKGIKPENQQRIFEQFTQEDALIAHQFGGTGLGLSICKELVEKMGGSISLKSIWGEGTTFTVSLTLPTVETTQHTSQSTATSDKPGDAANTDEQAPRILLVEDTPGNILVAEIVLGEMGYTPIVVMNGLEAIERYEEERFDLVLMDLRLPDMTGHEITTRFRNIEKERNQTEPTPIIAMTAFATDQEKEKCFDVGMNGFTTKPLEPDHFTDLIHEWLPSR